MGDDGAYKTGRPWQSSTEGSTLIPMTTASAPCWWSSPSFSHSCGVSLPGAGESREGRTPGVLGRRGAHSPNVLGAATFRLNLG